MQIQNIGIRALLGGKGEKKVAFVWFVFPAFDWSVSAQEKRLAGDQEEY